MNIQEGEFWSLTPLQYDALYDQWKIEQRRLDLRTGRIHCYLDNAFRDRKKHPETFDVEGYIPNYDEPPGPKKEGKKSGDNIKDKVMRMNSTLKNNPQKRRK